MYYYNKRDRACFLARILVPSMVVICHRFYVAGRHFHYKWQTNTLYQEVTMPLWELLYLTNAFL